MKRAALCLLCLFVLLPTAAFADSLDSINPSTFPSFILEQEATLQGTNLFGNLNGAPDPNVQATLLASTEVQVDGPAGTFVEGLNGASRAGTTDTIIMAIPDPTLLVEGHYSVTVIAHDTGGDRLIGTVFYDVVPQVIPPQPPLLAIPENVFAEATSASGANVSFFVGGFSFVDPPPAPTVVCDHNSGDLYPIGETIVHCTATDSFGSASGSFPVFVLDTTGPVVTVPADIITGNPVVTYSVSATDAVNGSVTVNCNPPSGATFPLGTTTVQCIAYDAQANPGFGSFNVTVSNGPVLTLPADITAEATSAAGAAVSYTVTATDNATIVCSPASGSTFALGTTTVNCTATAVTGNTSGSFHVTVVDTTPPTLNLPGTITAEATGPSGAAVTYTATATDLVDGSRPVTCDHASGSTFPLGSTTVQCTATDTHNNTAHGSFTVIVQDTTPPTIVSITASPNTLWPPNHKMVAVNFTVIATDLVDPHPVSHIVSISSSEPVNGNGDGNTSPDWEITGALTANIRAERAGGTDRVYTITIASTDFSGNSAFGTVTVTVGQSRGHAASH
ncbi:MAG TPA: HYR domain-containing protein [Thermoanaerobaculia bacterium]|nr:HYR domain-containing protein [Thermoanaerobaculia bacterium]